VLIISSFDQLLQPLSVLPVGGRGGLMGAQSLNTGAGGASGGHYVRSDYIHQSVLWLCC